MKLQTDTHWLRSNKDLNSSGSEELNSFSLWQKTLKFRDRGLCEASNCSSMFDFSPFFFYYSKIVLICLIKTFQPFQERCALLGLFTDLHLVDGQQTRRTNLRLVAEVSKKALFKFMLLIPMPRKEWKIVLIFCLFTIWKSLHIDPIRTRKEVHLKIKKKCTNFILTFKKLKLRDVSSWPLHRFCNILLCAQHLGTKYY